jgi:hypothetical protein
MSAAGWLQIAGTAVSVWGARDAARAARTAGEREKVAAEFNAAELERQAGIAVALGQREALEERRVADHAASRALAVAAASGAGVSDPTVVRLLAEHKGMGAYRASLALYEGEERARQFRIAAMSERIGGSGALEEGLARARAYNIRAIGTTVRTAGSLYAKYGAGGPEAAPEGHGDAALIRDYDPSIGGP